MRDGQLNIDLIEAAEQGDSGRVEELLQLGANPNAQHVLWRTTPLQKASHRGHIGIVQLLVAGGADVNQVAGDISTTALECAAMAGHLDIVLWLLERGARLPEGDNLIMLLADLEESGEKQIAAILRDRVP
jgi:ankyrin repeat protein